MAQGFHFNKNDSIFSLVIQWLRFRLTMQVVRVRSLVRELRAHMLMTKKIITIKKHGTEVIL